MASSQIASSDVGEWTTFVPLAGRFNIRARYVSWLLNADPYLGCESWDLGFFLCSVLSIPFTLALSLAPPGFFKLFALIPFSFLILVVFMLVSFTDKVKDSLRTKAVFDISFPVVAAKHRRALRAYKNASRKDKRVFISAFKALKQANLDVRTVSNSSSGASRELRDNVDAAFNELNVNVYEIVSALYNNQSPSSKADSFSRALELDVIASRAYTINETAKLVKVIV